MKKDTLLKKTQKHVRRWGVKHKDMIFRELGQQCFYCGQNNVDKLEIHHKEYKIGTEYVEILCQKCHHEFHRKEFLKRLLMIMKKNAQKSSEKYGIKTLDEYIKNLDKEINKIKVNIIPNVPLNGFPKENLEFEND